MRIWISPSRRSTKLQKRCNYKQANCLSRACAQSKILDFIHDKNQTKRRYKAAFIRYIDGYLLIRSPIIASLKAASVISLLSHTLSPTILIFGSLRSIFLILLLSQYAF